MTSKTDDIKEQLENAIQEILDYYCGKIKWLQNNIDKSKIDLLYKSFLIEQYNDVSFVYFIRNRYNNLVKIGSTKNITKRMGQIDSMFRNHFGESDVLRLESFVCVPSDFAIHYEHQIHNELATHRKYGEWFNIDYDFIMNKYFPDWYVFEKGICCALVDLYDIDNFMGNKKNKFPLEEIIIDNFRESLKLSLVKSASLNLFNFNNSDKDIEFINWLFNGHKKTHPNNVLSRKCSYDRIINIVNSVSKIPKDEADKRDRKYGWGSYNSPNVECKKAMGV